MYILIRAAKTKPFGNFPWKLRSLILEQLVKFKYGYKLKVLTCESKKGGIMGSGISLKNCFRRPAAVAGVTLLRSTS